MHRPVVVLRTGALDGGVGATDDDADDDALVSLHTCCEAISEARFWSSAAFSVLGTVSVKGGGAQCNVVCPFFAPLNVMTSVSCLVLCPGFFFF